MKELSKLLLLASIVGSTLVADEVRKTAYIGGASSEVLNETVSEFVFGFGADKIYNSGFVLGMNNEYSYGTLPSNTTTTDKNVHTVEFDLKLGYSPFKDFSIFGLGAAAGQYIENSGGYGFGYGAGIDYQLTKSIVLDVRYKTYSMQDSLIDYDYDKAVATLRYVF